MGMIDRIKNILVTPKTEWSVIEPEQTSTQNLLITYALPLILIGVIAGFVKGSILGTSILGATFRTPIMWGVIGAVFGAAMTFVAIFIMSFIVDALAPSFGGQKNFAQAMKVVVYSYTAAWIAAIFQIIPWVGPLLVILISLYSLYLIYLGLPVLMKCPEDKSIGYTAVAVICAIVVTVVLGLVTTMIVGLGGGMAAMSGASLGSASSSVTIDPNSPLARIEAMTKKAEEAGKKIEAAQKSGDPKAQMDAAAAALGALAGGAGAVAPLSIDQLKPFAPEVLGGLKRTSINSDSGGAAGVNLSSVRARYEDGQKSINLSIQDSGGLSGLLGLASWANVQSESEDQYSRSKSYQSGGRMIKEKSSKDPAGNSEYSVVLGGRFIVDADASGVPLDALKSAVNALDLSKLESMKDAGAKK
jgi:hypothetical protein